MKKLLSKRFCLRNSAKLLLALAWGLFSGQLLAFDCDHVDLDIPQLQCEALMVGYDSMQVSASSVNSNIKSQWSSETDFTVCDANYFDQGFFCQDEVLTKIYLPNRSLSGFIPAEFGDLADLKQLVMSSNQFSGTLTAELSDMPQLVNMELGDNNFSGAIPVEWASFQNLQNIYLEDNQLSIFTPELSQISTLKVLSLKGNLFEGEIPVEFGNFQNLRSLKLYSNLITGTIPAEIGSISSLRLLDLHDNLLQGEIPNELSNLSLLNYLYLQNNLLTGSIPASLGQLSALNEMRLNNNNLSGAFPDFSGTAIPEISGRVRIQENCIAPYPETTQDVVDWLAPRVTSGSSGSGLANQRTRANCYEDEDLIAQNGFGEVFQDAEILSVVSEDMEPEMYSTDGNILVLIGNNWKAVPHPYQVTTGTTLRFDFQAMTEEAEINGIGLTRDITGLLPVPEMQAFQVFGTELWTDNQVGNAYQIGDYVSYCVPVGEYFTGPIHYMVFVSDDDGGTVNNQWVIYDNYSLSETPCP